MFQIGPPSKSHERSREKSLINHKRIETMTNEILGAKKKFEHGSSAFKVTRLWEILPFWEKDFYKN
jgi:hypothetical protein